MTTQNLHFPPCDCSNFRNPSTNSLNDQLLKFANYSSSLLKVHSFQHRIAKFSRKQTISFPTSTLAQHAQFYYDKENCVNHVGNCVNQSNSFKTQTDDNRDGSSAMVESKYYNNNHNDDNNNDINNGEEDGGGQNNLSHHQPKQTVMTRPVLLDLFPAWTAPDEVKEETDGCNDNDTAGTATPTTGKRKSIDQELENPLDVLATVAAIAELLVESEDSIKGKRRRQERDEEQESSFFDLYQTESISTPAQQLQQLLHSTSSTKDQQTCSSTISTIPTLFRHCPTNPNRPMPVFNISFAFRPTHLSAASSNPPLFNQKSGSKKRRSTSTKPKQPRTAASTAKSGIASSSGPHKVSVTKYATTKRVAAAATRRCPGAASRSSSSSSPPMFNKVVVEQLDGDLSSSPSSSLSSVETPTAAFHLADRCCYENCTNPESALRVITWAGMRWGYDWTELYGKTVCSTCFAFFNRRGTLVRQKNLKQRAVVV